MAVARVMHQTQGKISTRCIRGVKTDEMLILLLAAWIPATQAFLAVPTVTRAYVSRSPKAASILPAKIIPTTTEFNSSSIGRFLEHSAASADGVFLRLNDGRIGTMSLVESSFSERNSSVDTYQITRPRWYNKAEATIIVLLVQRLQLLDARGVEHMLESTQDYRKSNPEDVLKRALFLMKIAPGANFRTVIQRHPRTLLISVHRMKQVYELITQAYPGVDMARIVERIPSVFSRTPDRLARNIQGLKEFAPEVDTAIFQAAPSMVFVPPDTTEVKVKTIRMQLPGVRLHTFLKGFPTGLTRSTKTIPKGLSELKKRFPNASMRELVKLVETAPSLIRMSGMNGTLDMRLNTLKEIMPGVNTTNVVANAPGVLIRNGNSLVDKVEKFEALFPSANVTKMVSRTPGILYLDVDRTARPKVQWIKQAVGLDQEGLDALIESGPWLLKAGWGPLARLEFAVVAGFARASHPTGLVGLVRRSRTAFAAAHHPAYANFLRRQLEQEDTDWSTSWDENEDGTRGTDGQQDEVTERAAKYVAQLEDTLGRVRKSRMGGVKDRPPRYEADSLTRSRGMDNNRFAFVDLEEQSLDDPREPQVVVDADEVVLVE